MLHCRCMGCELYKTWEMTLQLSQALVYLGSSACASYHLRVPPNICQHATNANLRQCHSFDFVLDLVNSSSEHLKEQHEHLKAWHDIVVPNIWKSGTATDI